MIKQFLLFTFCAAACFAGELFRDDFSGIPPRELSQPVKQLTNAIHEYHYLSHRDVPLWPWENAQIHADNWAGGDEDGKPYLEQHLISDRPRYWNPTMITGDPEWSDYTLEAKVRPLLKREMAGIVFRYHTNRHYYLFALTGGNKAVLRLRLPVETKLRVGDWKELGAADFPYDMQRYYALKVENDGPAIKAYIDGKLVLQASDGEILKGKIGVTATIPARFTDVRVTATDEKERQIGARIAARESELAALRASNPQPKLWKKFDTPRFGAGRNVRFGDLDGDGQVDMLIAQHVRKASRNAFDQISCLTAVNFDGKVLWQIGRPEPFNDVIANDTPFQIHDVDGDGKNEVVVVKDFKIQILEGATGKLKQWAWMPEAPADNDIRPYEREVGDSIYFLNVSGGKGQRDILIKDRYRTFWVYQQQAGTALERAVQHRALPLFDGCERRWPRRTFHGLLDVRGRRKEALEPRQGPRGPFRRAWFWAVSAPTRRAPSGRTCSAATRVSRCSTWRATSSSAGAWATPRAPASASTAWMFPDSSSCP